MDLETLMEKHLALQEELKAKESEIETLNAFKSDFTNKETEYKSEIGRLKETNMTLFLKVSQQEENQSTQEIATNNNFTQEPAQDWDSFMSNW